MKQTWTTRDFRLQSGDVLPELTLAYESYGPLAPGGRNAILVTHGFTSSQHAAGKYDPSDEAAGWWDGLIGPGKAIDTEPLLRRRVQHARLVVRLHRPGQPQSQDRSPLRPGVPRHHPARHRDGAEGACSTGSASRTWSRSRARRSAATRPSSGRSRIPMPWTASSRWSRPRRPRRSGGGRHAPERLAADPAWNGGWHYDHGGIVETMTAQRVETLQHYGPKEVLAAHDRGSRRARRRAPRAWPQRGPASSIPTHCSRCARPPSSSTPPATSAKIRAQVLYVLSRTDKLFPPSLAPSVMAELARAGVQATLLRDRHGARPRRPAVRSGPSGVRRSAPSWTGSSARS